MKSLFFMSLPSRPSPERVVDRRSVGQVTGIRTLLDEGGWRPAGPAQERAWAFAAGDSRNTYVCENSGRKTSMGEVEGERLVQVHPPHACATQSACPVHRKTPHPHRAWRQTFEDLVARRTMKTHCRRFMRRVCEHGRWVVDPDEPFKPTYAQQLELGMQDCARCNQVLRNQLSVDYERVAHNLTVVRYFLEEGNFAKEVVIVERRPDGKEEEYSFFPDEAELYLEMCLHEVSLELGL